MLGVGFDIHGGGLDLLFPHHENEAAQTRCARGAELAADLDAQRDARGRRRREDVASRSATSCACTRRSTATAGTSLVLYLASGHYRQPIAYGEDTLAAAAASVARIREAARRAACAGPSPAELRPLRDRFFAALADDFRTPEALAAMWEWIREANRRGEGVGGPAICARCSACSASRTSSTRRARRRRSTALAGRAPGRARGAATMRVPTRCARQIEELGWSVRDTPAGGFELDAARVIVYGRNAVREALRGRRAATVQWILATEAAAREPWLSGRDGAHRSRGRARASVRIARASGRLRRARPPTPTSRRGELLAGAAPLIVALDEVQDPQNLGAICRTAECVGASGVVICERRAAEVTPAVCRASAGAVEHLRIARARNLADFLDRAPDARAAGATARPRRRRRSPTPQPDYAGGVVLVFGAEGHGLRRRVAESCDALVALPLRGRIGSLNVSAAAGAMLYEVLRQRPALDSTP